MKTFKDLRFDLEEKTLTPAEKKKREEVAKAIERENPNMPMGMKMAIATKTAKRVAEEEDQQIVAEGSGGARYKIKSIGKDSKGDYYISPNSGKKVYKQAKVGDHETPSGEHKPKIHMREEVEKELNEANPIKNSAAEAQNKIQSSSKNKLKSLFKNAHPDSAKRMSEEVKDEYARKVDKYLKKKYNKEEIKITEGFDDYKKIAAELVKRHGKNVNKQHIKDLEDERDTRRPLDHSEVMKHVKQMHEEIEQVDEVSKKTAVSYIQKKVSQIAKRPGEAMLYSTKMTDKDYSNLKRAYKRAGVKEETELEEAINNDDVKKAMSDYISKGGKVEQLKSKKETKAKFYTSSTAHQRGRGSRASSVVRMEEVELDETKSAPKGFHFTKDGKLKRGDADRDGSGGPMLRSDPLDKTRNKVPPVSEEHYCAKHVYSNVYGEGVVLEGQHADPDENGNIEWYVVEFAEGPKKVYTEKLDIMVAEYHGNHKKKRMTNG